MRVGQNPIKAVEKIAPPAPVTVVIITHIPFLSGYYAQSLEILKLCLASLQANTEGDYDLMVFDNGSCAEVRNYLLAEQRKKRIQYLLLSERNLGKPAAWNSALAAAPGEFVAYADSDVYFYRGWLPASLEALKAFPKAGMVTAMPMLVPEKYSTATVKWAKKQLGVKVERGELLPWEDFWRHARSLGDDEDRARSFYAGNPAIRLTLKGKRYFVGAAHFQFTARKAALQAVLPIPAERPMGRVRLLDEAMNAAGYLRLCTDRWYVQHLGNVLPQASDFVIAPSGIRRATRPARRAGGIWRWAPLRKVLQWIYGWSFARLHRGQ
ncbi:MAG: glycosyltransferase family A protein [Anaerolineales bacterium]